MSIVARGDTVSRGGLSHLRRAAPTLERAAQPVAADVDSGDAPLRSQLRVLAVLRGVAALVQLAAICTMAFVWNVELPLAPSFATFGALVAVEATLVHRLRQPRPVTQREFFAHLLCDIAWLSISLYWMGGARHNPFVDLYTVYVGMAALVLDKRYAGLALAVALAAYALLHEHYVELRLGSVQVHGIEFESIAHTTEFVLLSLIVAYFGYRVSMVSRRHLEVAADTRERDCRRASEVNLASLAAGAAHEMGTPLTTIAVLVREMQRGGMSPEEQRSNLDAIWNAIQACKRSLSDMVAAVGADQLPERRPLKAVDFLQQAIELFKLMRPGVPVSLSVLCDQATTLRTDAALRQSLLALIVNAADASPASVGLVLRCARDTVQIDILDRGPGIAPEVRKRLGAQLITTKAGYGCGLGVFLANLNISRMGGRLEFLERDGGGTCVRVTLPTDEH